MMDYDLQRKIDEQKRIAIRSRDRLHWIILASMLAGFVGAIIWIWIGTTIRPGAVVGTSVTSAVLLGTLITIICHRHEAKCPKCGFDWEIDERSPSHMLKWTKCPGCGLEMMAEKK